MNPRFSHRHPSGMDFLRINRDVMDAFPKDRDQLVKTFVLAYFMFRCNRRKHNPDGRWLCSLNDLTVDLPLTLEQVRRGIRLLKAEGYLISANYRPPQRQAYWLGAKALNLKPYVPQHTLKGRKEQSTTPTRAETAVLTLVPPIPQFRRGADNARARR